MGPSADPQEELLKKALSCGVILIACLVFAKWYEKFTTKIGVAQIPICRAMPMIWVRSLKKTTTAQVA